MGLGGMYGYGGSMGLSGGAGGFDYNSINLGTGYAGGNIGYGNMDSYNKGMGLQGVGLGQSQIVGMEGSGMASVGGLSNGLVAGKGALGINAIVFMAPQ